MPASAARAWAAGVAVRLKAKLPFQVISRAGGQLIYLITERCDVSQRAARVRLLQLGLLVERR